MSESNPTTDLEARVAGLERALAASRGRALALGVVALLLGATALALVLLPRGELNARTLELTSPDGMQHVRLDAEQGLRLWADGSATVIELRQQGEIARLALLSKGDAAIELQTLPDSARLGLVAPDFRQQLLSASFGAVFDASYQKGAAFENSSIRLTPEGETLRLAGLRGERHHAAELHVADDGAWLEALTPTASARLALTAIAGAGPTLTFAGQGTPQIELGTIGGRPGLRVDGKERLAPAP